MKFEVTNDITIVSNYITEYLDMPCPDCNQTKLELHIGQTVGGTPGAPIELIWMCSECEKGHAPKIVITYSDEVHTGSELRQIVQDIAEQLKVARDNVGSKHNKETAI